MLEWLVASGELSSLPDENYNPMADARLHLAEHAPSRCNACGVWQALLFLWEAVEALFETKEIALEWKGSQDLKRAMLRWQEETTARRNTLSYRGYGEAADAIDAEVSSALFVLERFCERLLAIYPAEVVEVVRTARFDAVTARACQILREADFSYREIAEVLGEEGDGKARVRARLRARSR